MSAEANAIEKQTQSAHFPVQEASESHLRLSICYGTRISLVASCIQAGS
jgi:hypothetical protein